MATKKGTYKIDNGTGYDEIMFKTTAEQVVESTTKRFVSDTEKNNWNDARTKALDWNIFKTNGGQIEGPLVVNSTHINIQSNKTADINLISKESNKILQSVMWNNDSGGYAEIRLKNGNVVNKSLKISDNGFQFNSGISTQGDWTGVNMYRTDGKRWGMYVHETNPNLKIHTDINGISREMMYIGTSSMCPIETMTLGEANGYKWKDIYLTGLSTNKIGYNRLPNGMIMQWMYADWNQDGSTTRNFPIAFPTACLSVTATCCDPNERSVSVSSVTRTSLKLKPQTYVYCYVLAIGY